MMNIAQLAGPIVGGALYEAGGFKTPFILMGGIQTIMAFATLPFLPDYDGDCSNLIVHFFSLIFLSSSVFSVSIWRRRNDKKLPLCYSVHSFHLDTVLHFHRIYHVERISLN